jgi:hypothetical protein
MEAVQRRGQEQEQQRYARAQQQFKNQLEAQRAEREREAFTTEEAMRRATIAAQNAQTLHTQQLIKGGDLARFQTEAENGRAKVQPYIDAGIAPMTRDKTWQEIQKIVAANPKASAWDWEQTGWKTIINADGRSDYAPTFDAYDPDRKVPVTKEFLDLLKKAKIDDVYPGTTDRLRVGQELSPQEFSALKQNYQKKYNDDLALEKQKLLAGETSERIKVLQAEFLKNAIEAAKAKKADKQASLLADALDEWNKAGPGQEGFAKLNPKSQFVISTNLVKTIDSLERQIKDALSQIPPDEERADELKEQQEQFRTLQRMAIGTGLPKAPTPNAPIPDDVMAQYVRSYGDPMRAKQAATQAGWGPPASLPAPVGQPQPTAPTATSPAITVTTGAGPEVGTGIRGLQ